MPLATAICIGKLCASAAAILGAAASGHPVGPVKEVFDALASGGEATAKLRGPETQHLQNALQKAQAKLQASYDEARQHGHSPGFADTVDTAFANLSEVFEHCIPHGPDLARLQHDPQAIGEWVATKAAARHIDVFHEGEGRKLLVALVVLAYTSLDNDPAFMAALQRVNWTENFHLLADLKTDVAALHKDVTELLSLARHQGRFQLAAEAGISERAVRNIVERLGGEGIDPADLLPWLDDWIEAARNQLGRHTNEDQAFEAARREAERRFRAGHDNASAALMDELAREQHAEAERQDERKRRQLRLLEEAIRFDELGLKTDAAIAKLRRMAQIEGHLTPDQVGTFLATKANESYERGETKGIASPLLLAVATYQAALEQHTRERAPLAWAMTQNNLGNALATLGEREAGTARLEQAVTAYKAALEEHTRERVPLAWATTQNNLGNALARLGEREAGTARLEQAVTAYQAALKEWTRERVPLDWAGTQNNLGNALRMLGAREAGTARLDQAVTAYQAALKEWTRERVPLDWAMTQNNLGAALQTLGEREAGTSRLEQAVAAYQAALEEWTRERVPLDWAMTQNNLGNALRTLGAREAGTARLDQALAAFDACLTVAASNWLPEWVSYVQARKAETRAETARRTAKH